MTPSQLFAKVNTSYILLFIIAVISVLIRLWLLDKRWINPDEGAHLMDAILVLDGHIPGVDFNSRQPFYVYTIAGFLKMFGVNYVSGRLLPVMSSMLTGILVFLLADALFDSKVATLSAAIYWLLPLEVSNSVLLKTEPLAVLLTCLALYSVIRYRQGDQWMWMIVAGSVAAMAFYVRQSALIIPPTVFAFLVLLERGRFRRVARGFAVFVGGYTAVLLAVFVFYGRFMSAGDFVLSGPNPFGFLTSFFEWLRADSVRSMESTGDLGSGGSTISWKVYYNYIHQGVYLHAFLFLGVVFSVLGLGSFRQGNKGEPWFGQATARSLLYVWVVSLLAAYGLYFFARGFFIDYARELLPPVVIIFSAWLLSSVPSLTREGALERFIVCGIPLGAIVFVIQANYKAFFGVGHHASLAVLLMILVTFGRRYESSARRILFVSTMVGFSVFIIMARYGDLKGYLSGVVPSLATIAAIYAITWVMLEERWRPSIGEYAQFVKISLMFGFFVVSMSYSGMILDFGYDSIWSPESVRKTATYLRTHTNAEAEVMSGAVIWEVQGARRPFENISHPLAFEHRMSEGQRGRILHAAATRPPEVIILDGYTEKTYIRQMPSLMELLEARYRLVIDVGPARYPVRVYQLKEERV
jgi:hypothetical protein